MKSSSDDRSDGPTTQTLLRMGDVCKLYSLSATTVRRATKAGLLPCFHTVGNHRRFKHTDILDFLTKHRGEGSEDAWQEEIGSNGRIPIAAVCRVSGHGQNKAIGRSEKSSLQHQEDRVREGISKRFGTDAVDITWFRSVGSGLNFDRKELLDLLSQVLEGRFRGGHVVATDFTRLCRFGVQLVAWICSKGGCSIIYTSDTETEKDFTESLSDELIGLITWYTAKASSNKSREVTIVRLSEEQLRYAYELKISGESYRGIVLKFARKGWQKNEKGKKISHVVVRSRLKESWDVLQKLYGDPKANSFVVFSQKFISTAVIRDKKSTRADLAHTTLMRSYKRYCKQEGIKPVSSRVIRAAIKNFGWKSRDNPERGQIYIGQALSFASKAKKLSGST